MTTNLCPAFGFRSGATYAQRERYIERLYGSNKSTKQIGAVIARVDAASKILGYVPLAGIGIGIWRLVKDDKSVDGMQKLGRSIVEILGAGILFLPVDITMVAVRNIRPCFSTTEE